MESSPVNQTLEIDLQAFITQNQFPLSMDKVPAFPLSIRISTVQQGKRKSIISNGNTSNTMVSSQIISEEQQKLCKQNDIVKDKIVKILTSKHKFRAFLNEQCRDFSRSNYFYERRRFQTSIDRQNPQIARRILKASANLSSKKDSQDFKKSRQFVRRLQRFPVLKRLQKSIDSARSRIKTEEKQKTRPNSIMSKKASPHFSNYY